MIIFISCCGSSGIWNIFLEPDSGKNLCFNCTENTVEFSVQRDSSWFLFLIDYNKVLFFLFQFKIIGFCFVTGWTLLLYPDAKLLKSRIRIRNNSNRINNTVCCLSFDAFLCVLKCVHEQGGKWPINVVPLYPVHLFSFTCQPANSNFLR